MRRERGADGHDLGAVEHPVGSVPACRGRDVLPVVTGRRLGGGERDDRLPGDDVLQQVGCDVAARATQQARGHHRGVDVGLDDERVTQRLGDHHHLDGPAADAADVFGQGGAEDAEFVGERAPDVGLPARSGLDGRPALLQVIAGRRGTW